MPVPTCREFDLAKAEEVIGQLKAEHDKWNKTSGLPFMLPKTWPGMQLVLQRMSTKIEK